MKRPVEPNKEDCCQSGCNPCIFDVYEKQLTAYQKYLESGATTDNEPKTNAISQLNYTPFKLLKQLEICDSHKVLMFIKSDKNDDKVKWRPGEHFLVKYVFGDKSYTRAYTPLHLEQFECDFCIIAKRYNNGSVSTYLSNLTEGEICLWRGPYGSFEHVANKFQRIIMFAQGTGLVTFISIIQNIINNEDDMTRIILYYCCPSEDKILLREELYAFKEYWNFTYNIFLSNPSCNVKLKYLEPIIFEKLNLNNILLLSPFSLRDQFLICGSPEFMEYYENLLKRENIEVESIIKF